MQELPHLYPRVVGRKGVDGRGQFSAVSDPGSTGAVALFLEFERRGTRAASAAGVWNFWKPGALGAGAGAGAREGLCFRATDGA
jgi:hypothetical protein